MRDRGGEEAQVSHLLFVDDTLVFYGAFQDQMTYLSWTLMWFEAILRLRINFDKNELIPNAEAMATELVARSGVFLPRIWDCR